jgi:hypothetical protein
MPDGFFRYICCMICPPMYFAIIYGLYRFAQKIVGYRQDYCNQCRAHVLAQCFRYFRCGHIFFIPLLPLGFKESWHCYRCGGNPRANYNPKAEMLTAVANFLTMIGFFLIIGPMTFMRSSGMALIDLVPVMGIGAGCIAIAGLLLWWTRRIIASDFVRPSIPNTEACPMCGGKLSTDPHLSCPSCQVRVYTD